MTIGFCWHKLRPAKWSQADVLAARGRAQAGVLPSGCHWASFFAPCSHSARSAQASSPARFYASNSACNFGGNSVRTNDISTSFPSGSVMSVSGMTTPPRITPFIRMRLVIIQSSFSFSVSLILQIIANCAFHKTESMHRDVQIDRIATEAKVRRLWHRRDGRGSGGVLRRGLSGGRRLRRASLWSARSGR